MKKHGFGLVEFIIPAIIILIIRQFFVLGMIPMIIVCGIVFGISHLIAKNQKRPDQDDEI